MTSPIYELSSTYVDRLAALDPVLASGRGIPGHDTELTDYSPDGYRAQVDLAGATLTALDTTPILDERDRIARDVLRERLQLELDRFAAREHLRSLRSLFSPMQRIRMSFDQMPRSTEPDWETLAIRLERVPWSLQSFQRSLEEGLRQGLPVARRQVEECAGQAATWVGTPDGPPPFFAALVAPHGERPDAKAALTARLEQAAQAATEAYAAFGRFLQEDYGPHAGERDAVGSERYALASRDINGIDFDLGEAYAWAWDELHRVERELTAVCDQLKPGLAFPQLIAALGEDPAYAVHDVDELRAWIQEQQDRAIAELNGRHFAIPEPLTRLEVLVAPPGSALAPAYYTPPSEGLDRPGRVWLASDERLRVERWVAPVMAYHEGVPGHHLQVGGLRCLTDQLSRFQRLFALIPGYSEGWATYAERLVGELGYLDAPLDRFGALSSRVIKCLAAINDIGQHLELSVPRDAGQYAGERLTPDVAAALLAERRGMPPAQATALVTRSLGWPGQATAYNLGERVWLQVREEARGRAGAAFTLKDFHEAMLSLGPMSLGQLQREAAARW